MTGRNVVPRATLATATAIAALVAVVPARADEARARAAIDRALSALGGLERIEAMPAWIVEGHGRENLTAENQGEAPDRPTWRPHEERIAVDWKSLAVAWERKTPRNDSSLRWRRFIWRADSTGVYDWNASYGALRAANNPAERRRAIARRVPPLLLADVARHATALESRGERNVDGAICDVVGAVLPGAPAALEIAIGRDPAVVRRVGYETRFPGFGETRVQWRWTGWRRDAQLGFVPSGHRILVGDTVFQEVDYSRYAASAEAAEQLFAQPRPTAPAHAGLGSHAASAVLDGAAAPAFGEVAPEVHVFDARGFTCGWIELRDFVVAFEAPEVSPGLEAIPAASDTTRRTRLLLDEIARVSPGKPVRYAVISHHHGDHMGGASEYARAGAVLIVAREHRAAAERAVKADRGAPPPRIETVDGRRVIEDGARRVEILDVGPNPHTGASLCVWVPDAGVLFQGDLFYFEAGGPFPPSGRGTMDRFFARWLADRALEPRAIYGVHDDAPAGSTALEAARALPAASPPAASPPAAPR